MASRRSIQAKAEKLSFRLSPRYAEKVAEASQAANVSPNQFARIATMIVAQNGLVGLSGEVGLMHEALIRLRDDFNRAVSTD